MYMKVFIVSVLVCFIGVQLATSLQCFECDTPNSCKNPSRVNCDETAANRTRARLNTYFINVSNTTTNNFSCLQMNYTQNLSPVMETRGCIYPEINSCNLNINATVAGTWTRAYCNHCSGNLCNGNNPAAAISGSGVFTLLATVVTVLAAKAIATH